MSVLVENIIKIYGKQHALDGVSFKAEQGQVLGFLGPNGAGKSTMMKIITCFIPQTSGSVTVCGFDVNEEPMEVKKRVGYLPEHNPLYPEMYVKEYLEFTAGIHGMRSKVKEKINEVIEITGLEKEYKKRIAELSKGYRQRVGLANALVHNPEILILDEPTSGLDPNQLLEIRELIKKIGKEKTVILSTHIMQEVEAICDRVIIISQGKIVADDDTQMLRKKLVSDVYILVEFDQAISKELLLKADGVSQVESLSDKKWKVKPHPGQDIRASLFNFAVKNNLAVLALQQEEQGLEEVFRQLTH